MWLLKPQSSQIRLRQQNMTSCVDETNSNRQWRKTLFDRPTPIGIGEVLRRIIEKSVMAVLKKDFLEAAYNCVRITILAVKSLFML